jgi:hypothetical protein
MKRTAVIFAVAAICSAALLLGRASPALGACYWEGTQNVRGDTVQLDAYTFVGSTVYWTYGRDCYGRRVQIRIDRIVGSEWATAGYRAHTRSLGWAYIYDRPNDGLHEWFSAASTSCSAVACGMTINYYPGKVLWLSSGINVSLACMHCSYWGSTSWRYFHYFLQGGIVGEGEYPGSDDGQLP